VDKQLFTELLKGKLPDGSDLTRIQDGVNKHRPGYDLTFSARKVYRCWLCWAAISVLSMPITGGNRSGS
jgi:conjugative relaxase-like TrwC/TraI family protein